MPRARAVGAGFGGASLLRVGTHALCALPALHLLTRHVRGTLGVDPLDVLVRACGWWAAALLVATLAVTPLRRLSVSVARLLARRWGRRVADWNGLIRSRRALGLWAFAYAFAHLALYAVLDAGSWDEAWRDVRSRPFIAVGLLAFLLLLPLAATSTQAAIRRLKKRWVKLHRCIYPAAVLVLLHAWMQTKAGHIPPWELVVGAAAVALLRVPLRRASHGLKPDGASLQDAASVHHRRRGDARRSR